MHDVILNNRINDLITIMEKIEGRVSIIERECNTRISALENRIVELEYRDIKLK